MRAGSQLGRLSRDGGYAAVTAQMATSWPDLPLLDFVSRDKSLIYLAPTITVTATALAQSVVFSLKQQLS